MSVHKLLSRLTQAGHTIAVADGMIHVMPPAPVAELRAHKQEILELFAKQSEAIAKLPEYADCPLTAQIETPWGTVWMVPNRTDRIRFEIEWREMADPLAVLARVKQVLLAATILDGAVKHGV